MKTRPAVTVSEQLTGAKSGMKIRTALKAGRIARNVNRTLVARKKVRPGAISKRKGSRTSPR